MPSNGGLVSWSRGNWGKKI